MIDQVTQVVFSPRTVIFTNICKRPYNLSINKDNITTSSSSTNTETLPFGPIKPYFFSKFPVPQPDPKKETFENKQFTSRSYSKNLHPMSLSVVNMSHGLSQSPFPKQIVKKPKKEMVRNIHTAASCSRFKKVSESAFFQLKNSKFPRGLSKKLII